MRNNIIILDFWYSIRICGTVLKRIVGCYLLNTKLFSCLSEEIIVNQPPSTLDS